MGAHPQQQQQHAIRSSAGAASPRSKRAFLSSAALILLGFLLGSYTSSAWHQHTVVSLHAAVHTTEHVPLGTAAAHQQARRQQHAGEQAGLDRSSSSSSSSRVHIQLTARRAGSGTAATASKSEGQQAAAGRLPTSNSTPSTQAPDLAAVHALDGSQDSSSSSSSSNGNVGSSSSSSSGSTDSGRAPAAQSEVSGGGNSLRVAGLVAAARAAHDSAYRQKLQQAAAAPINIAVMSALYWKLPTDHTKGCSVDGIPLDCHIQEGGTEEFLNAADALYYHVPSFGGKPRAKAFPNQLRIAMSLESAAYFPSLDSPRYMCHFDAEMTYRTCAQVTNWYSLEAFDKLFQAPPVPFEEKLHAIAYVNSNCGAQSGRAQIMRQLIALGAKGKVPVHSLGRCDNNTPWPAGNPNKVEVMRKYKFCVAMENSVRQDYMTEKLWDALAAGCVPVYLGSQHAPQIIPDARSIILYDDKGAGNASTPEQLDALMHEIGSDRVRYESMVAWKSRKPDEQPSEVFRYLWGLRHTTGECFLCQFLARHRAEPQPRYITCLFNKEWMRSAGQQFVSEQDACPHLASSVAAG